MTSVNELPGTTPVLVGVGQFVKREPGEESAADLAAAAAKAAIADSGADLASEIDTICMVKTFNDSVPSWAGPYGTSNNQPQSVAARIGANPKRRIYTHAGGNEPQSRLTEFAGDIARGEADLVLLCGAENIKNLKNGLRNGLEMDWNESFDEPLDDRGFGEHVATLQERNTGLTNVMYYYGLIDQAQADAKGRSAEEHRQASAKLFESFSAVASTNPYAQFEGKQSAEQILAADPLSHLYTKRMIAQDGVNLAAAVLLCSIDKARELGIPESQWVFLHGAAEGMEWEVSRRPNPAVAEMAGMVAHKALDMAGVKAQDIELIDIYSCFPCAVVAVAEQLGLPTDGSRQLTLTGGLPYFGGPGNNYSMHAIAQAAEEVRKQPDQYALVTANGGVLSKHATGVYSCLPSAIDWCSADVKISRDDLPHLEICEEPSAGTIVSWSVNHARQGLEAVVVADTSDGQRFVAMTAEDDSATAEALLNGANTGQPISVIKQDQKLVFQLAS